MTGTLLWGLWRRARWHLLTLPAGMALLSMLVISVVPLDDVTNRVKLGSGLLWVGLIGLAVNLIALAEGRSQQGFDSRLFVLPVSSGRFAATWIAGLVGVMASAYFGGSLILAAWLGSAGPDAGSLLFICAAVSWLLFAIWATPGHPARRTGLSLVVAAAFIGLVLTAGGGRSIVTPLASLKDAGPLQLTLLGLLFSLAFPASAWAIARHRRGDATPGQIDEPRGLRRLAPGPPPDYPFGSDFAALLWLAFREKGLLIPALFSAPWLCVLVAGLTGWMEEPELARFAIAQVNFALFFGPVLVAGVVCRLQEGNLGDKLDDLRALRPVSSGTLAGVYLVHGGLSLALAWGLAATGAAITLAALGASPKGSSPPEAVVAGLQAAEPEALIPQLMLTFLLLLILGWLQLGLLSAILLTGRNSAAALFILLPYSIAAALLVFPDSISNLPAEKLLEWAPWIVGLLGLTATAIVLALALVKRLFRPFSVMVQLIGLAVVVATIAFSVDLPGAPRAFALLGIVAATLVPWPATSLALRWNRHR